MYRNIQQETWKVWYLAAEKARTVLAKYPLSPGQSFKKRWVAIGNIRQREGKRFFKLQDWTKFRRRFPRRELHCPIPIVAGVFFYPPFLGTLKFPAVVGNNGLLVKT